jgi:hypothetical protein
MKYAALMMALSALLARPVLAEEMHFKHGSITVQCSSPDHDDMGAGDSARVIIGPGMSIRCDEAGHITLYSPYSFTNPAAAL